MKFVSYNFSNAFVVELIELFDVIMNVKQQFKKLLWKKDWKRSRNVVNYYIIIMSHEENYRARLETIEVEILRWIYSIIKKIKRIVNRGLNRGKGNFNQKIENEKKNWMILLLLLFLSFFFYFKNQTK